MRTHTRCMRAVELSITWKLACSTVKNDSSRYKPIESTHAWLCTAPKHPQTACLCLVDAPAHDTCAYHNNLQLMVDTHCLRPPCLLSMKGDCAQAVHACRKLLSLSCKDLTARHEAHQHVKRSKYTIAVSVRHVSHLDAQLQGNVCECSAYI